MTPTELEQWVLRASDMSLDQQKRWEATNLLNAWVEQNKEGGVVIRCLLDLVTVTRNETVLFYALTTLQRLTMSLPERVELRNMFFSHQQNYYRASTFLKTKAAVVLALLTKTDYPTNWPQALEDVRTKTNSEFSLRTILALLEDLGTHGDDDATRVKDAMRGFRVRPTPNIPLEATATAYLMDWIVDIMTGAFPRIVGFNGGGDCSNDGAREAFVCVILAFQVLKCLASWIDISLVLKETVLNLVFCGLETNHIAIAVPAVETLQEVVGRGMPSGKKVDLLVHLDLLKRIHNSKVNIETVDVSPIEVVIEIAKLINMTGLELLPIWESQEQSDSLPLNTLLQQLLDLFFRCFAYDDIDVSGAVIPLASRLTVTVDKEKNTASSTNGQQHLNITRHLPQLMATMFLQMRYPADFEFDFENEAEAEEEVYRTELRNLNQALVRSCPEASLQFLCEALANLPVPISSCPTPDLEAALRLVYHYCEGIRPPPGMKIAMKNETFCSVLVALHKIDITAHPHREVLLLYYDVCVRYHPIFKNHPELLPLVLESISGTRGLQHTHAKVRSRSCYLLLRLVKSVASALRPYVETAVSGIEGLLSNPNTYPLRPDDTLYLFETIGLLLGKTGLDPSEQQKHLTKVMTPHVVSIKEVLSCSDLAGDLEHYGAILSGSVAAFAFLSKGFSRPPPEVQLVLLETVSITLGVLEALPENERVRSKSMILIQRMIQCLGNKVLPTVPRFLHILIEHCTSEDILDVAQLLNQLCLKFKQESVAAIDAALLPFLRKCHSLMPATGDVVASKDNVPPHLLTEQLSIKKLTFAFLQYVVIYGATTVLLTATNLNALESVLQNMNDGATLVEDPGMKRACIIFFRELVDQWAGAETENAMANENFLVVQRGFVKFVFEVFVPGMIKCMLSSSFNERDAMQSRNATEMGKVLFLLKAKRGIQEFEHYVLGGSLANAHCPPNVINGFRTASNEKEMTLCLKEMMKSLKPQNAGS